MLKFFIIVWCALISTASVAVEKDDYLQFFNEYQRLSSAFDASLSTLYANDAKIKGVRKQSDGKEEKMTIDGNRWKTIIISSMENAKASDDHYVYSNVKISTDQEFAKITATRYSELNCFTDNNFYMMVQSSNDGQMQIVEQFMESPIQSNCENSESDLKEFLNKTVEMINSQLPAEVDAETQLIKTSTDGNRLIYHYVLVNYTTETLSTDDASKVLQPLVIQQSCTSPNLRPILDQGGDLSYIYKGSDAVEIAKFDVDITAC